MPSYTSQLMLDEARRRGWQAAMVADGVSPIMAITLPDSRVEYVYSCMTSTTSAAGYTINQNKLVTYRIAEQHGIPVCPYHLHDPAIPDASEVFWRNQIKSGHDVVVKPTNADHGNGIAVGVPTEAALHRAIEHAGKYSKHIIIQQRHRGDDCRVTVVDGVCVAAVRRTPPAVIGNGMHTIRELIAKLNADPRRRKDTQAPLRPIAIDDARRYLGESQLEAVPANGQRTAVLGTANVSKGGESEDITDELHETYKAAAIQLAKVLGLGVCGIDFLIADISRPLSAGRGVLIEINCAIGLRLHHLPTKGKPRDVAGAILDALARSPGR